MESSLSECQGPTCHIKNLISAKESKPNSCQISVFWPAMSKRRVTITESFFLISFFCHIVKTNCHNHPVTIAQESIMPCSILCHHIITSQKGSKFHKMQHKPTRTSHQSKRSCCVFYAFHLQWHTHYSALKDNHEVLIDMFWGGN